MHAHRGGLGLGYVPLGYLGLGSMHALVVRPWRLPWPWLHALVGVTCP